MRMSMLLLLVIGLFATNGLMTSGLTVTNNTVGINYGMVADNLPPPQKAMELIKSMGISKVKIYSTNVSTLDAFAHSGISMIVGIGNEDLHSLTDPKAAIAWVQAHIAPYVATTRISAIAVGNEVLTTNNTQLIQDLLPAILNVHTALSSLP
eukprot:c8352_g1_i1 orf=3-455(-)